MFKFVLVSFVLTSCIGSHPEEGDYLKPGGRVMSYIPSGGSDAYNKGWRDGCESGMSIYSYAFQKMFYSFKKDIRFTTDFKYEDERDLFNGHQITSEEKGQYSSAWSSTYITCRHYAIGALKGRINMQPTVPGHGPMIQLHGLDQIYDPRASGSIGGGNINW